MGCNVFPDDGVIHSNLVPCELARRLEDLRHRLKNHFPTLSYLFLDHGIMSASEIARTVKSREFDWVKRIMDQQEPNPNRPKTPKDRERIGEITSAYRSAYLATIVTFVRERQQRDLDTADSRFPFTPKDLDDEDVLAAECRRTMGWTPRKKNPVGFAMPKLTKEQELGWTGYKFGRGTNPDTSLGADHAAHMSTARSGTQKIKGSLAANDKYEAERAGGNDQE
jgi:hypothetical protein